MRNVFFIFYSVILLSGCGKIFTGYEEELSEYNFVYIQNNCSSVFIEKMIDSGSDLLLWSELGGSLKRKCKDYEASNHYFDRAEKYYKEEVDLENFGEKTLKSVGTILTNENLTDYHGNVFEAIMVNTYKGLNFMSLGKQDLARVEFNRALDRQRRAKLLFKSQIERKQKELEEKEREKNSLADREKTFDFVKESYERGLFYNFQAYPDFVNPFTTYMAALFALSSNDYEKARYLFRESMAMDPENEFITDDFQLADKWMRAGQGEKKYIWLIYENGKNLRKDEVRIDIPVFLVSDKVFYAQIVLPTLREQPDSYTFLTLNANRTRMIADMDRIVKTEFKNKLPLVLLKAVTQTITKAVIEASMSSKDELLGIGAELYNILTSRADVRSWVSLPKNFQAVRVENTGKGAIIQTDTKEVLESIDIAKDKNVILYLSSSVPGFYVLHTILF